jgi:hypothetical protein
MLVLQLALSIDWCINTDLRLAKQADMPLEGQQDMRATLGYGFQRLNLNKSVLGSEV